MPEAVTGAALTLTSHSVAASGEYVHAEVYRLGFDNG